MNENDSKQIDFNRRDFLKSGSFATLMTMLGGVELFAQTNAAPAEAGAGPKVKVGVIGLGAWGREIVNTLVRIPQAEVAAVCDTYAASLNRGGNLAPGSVKTDNYKAILDNKDIKAVVIATPTQKHAEIALAALKAGKHVYCEAPLANTVEDARAIAAAAKASTHLVFQSGLQLRSDPQRHFLVPFIRSGALGQTVLARAQWHRKTSWRATASTPQREKELNWRLDKQISTGLIGELGCGAIDQAAWFINAQPVAVTGFGAVTFWKDGRDVPDAVQALIEFPGGVMMNYQATLVNSFDGEYEMFYGSDAAIMLRQSKAWLFKEVDSPLLGWEVYAKKETFYKETGIILKAGASKSVDVGEIKETPFVNTPLSFALTTFLRNTADVVAATEDAAAAGIEDPTDLAEIVAKVGRRPAAGYLEGLNATVTVIKANEAVLGGQRVLLKPEWYELT